ncbi:hypothetical protein [Pseudorhodoferax soli]|uniref:Uncharacterized protein n=1 Tax=Pseudorhodoferax soli TaxID=545864 RepID=A0A368XDJ5_9BURK|nr:hypothetical protein [Pseudorhodoferax soli]RCW65088.1 hypothetical protein DES41_11312 [Pseudorhodoferax soli]
MNSPRVHLILLIAAWTSGPAFAQTSPAYGQLASPVAPSQDPPLSDYLALLGQIAPAAQSAARTYIAAVRLRCGYEMDAGALRQIMARSGGDPVLMGLIRAEASQDAAARKQLVAQIPCSAKLVP